MSRFFSHRKTIKRRRLFINGISRENIVASFLFALGKKILTILKRVFFRVMDVIRYNPLVPKVAWITCLSVFITGAFFLVFFAIASPELPPENVVSTIYDISSSNGANSGSQIILLPNGDNWAALTTFTFTDDDGIGTGTLQDRSEDIEYPVRPGETLSEIAYSYGIGLDFLAWYNRDKINDPNRIRANTAIIIPSIENIALHEPLYEVEKASRPQVVTPRASKSIEIAYESHNNGSGSGITVHFSIVNPPADLRSYEWDLGDGKRSFREDPSYDYSTPKTYTIRLTAQDSTGVIYKSNPLYIVIPYPASSPESSTTKFITIPHPEEFWSVNGTITKVAGYSSVEASPLFLEQIPLSTQTIVHFQKSGYYGITVQEIGGREQFYSVFVSPVPTKHVDGLDSMLAENNFNWYRTQFGTGTTGNCGPASVSMAIGWGAGRYYSTASVRQEIGWDTATEGATSFEQLIGVIRRQGVSASIQPLRSVQDIRNVIDSGAIAIILYHTGGIRPAMSNASIDLVGKYYNDSVGHYSVIKGYSLNGDYFVIHDPIPSDWGTNSFRYADGISMIGQNRYYHSVEVLRSLRRADMIVVPGGQF